MLTLAFVHNAYLPFLGSKSPAPRKSEGQSGAMDGGKVVGPWRGDGNFRTGKVAKIREMFEKRKAADENAIQFKKTVPELQSTPQREVVPVCASTAG